MHSIKRGSRSFARSIVSEKLLCRWVAPPAGRVAQIFIGTGARLGIREPSAKTPADMGYFAVQMWLTVRYLHILDSLEIVHPLQGLELFAKMVYYKTHYKFDTEHKVIIDAFGPYIENKIINATQIRPFNLKELYDLMKNVLQLRGVTDEIPEYVEGKMFSFIPRKV